MERDYSRLRHIEMRYRLLFELSVEAVLIVDATTLRIVDVNPAARRLLGDGARNLVGGRSILQVFADASTPSVRSLLDTVRAGGRPDQVDARLARPEQDVVISASLFRHDNTAMFLVRLSTKSATAETAFPKLKSKMLKIVESAPDGFVMTGPDGRVLAANAAFVDMVNARAEDEVRGQPLERWIGRPGVDAEILLTNLRQRGSVRLYGTTLNVDYGPTSQVEISAVSVMNGGTPCFGFTLRNVGQRLSADLRSPRQLPRTPEQLAQLIGRMSLKDLVRETSDVIERLCIEAALELTSNNRASAAELLGLSRQSLYVKLRRYGLADDPVDD
jgi:transcriptional regulator PpsR